ncbi:hypothetical protein EV126DRAFT_410055 [Verticillium dahliae]|nr:hypothetical protein EV126DRAFT_410055 [Verticillium dahliae]
MKTLFLSVSRFISHLATSSASRSLAEQLTTLPPVATWDTNTEDRQGGLKCCTPPHLNLEASSNTVREQWSTANERQVEGWWVGRGRAYPSC